MPATTVLFVGFDPALMDLGVNGSDIRTQIQAGIDRSMREIRELGFDAEFMPLDESDDGAEAALRSQLEARTPDCVVIGAGVRLMPKHTALFEALVNAVRELAPEASLAFNATPADAAEAVQRRVCDE